MQNQQNENTNNMLSGGMMQPHPLLQGSESGDLLKKLISNIIALNKNIDVQLLLKWQILILYKKPKSINILYFKHMIRWNVLVDVKIQQKSVRKIHFVFIQTKYYF